MFMAVIYFKSSKCFWRNNYLFCIIFIVEHIKYKATRKKVFDMLFSTYITFKIIFKHLFLTIYKCYLLTTILMISMYDNSVWMLILIHSMLVIISRYRLRSSNYAWSTIYGFIMYVSVTRLLRAIWHNN